MEISLDVFRSISRDLYEQLPTLVAEDSLLTAREHLAKVMVDVMRDKTLPVWHDRLKALCQAYPSVEDWLAQSSQGVQVSDQAVRGDAKSPSHLLDQVPFDVYRCPECNELWPSLRSSVPMCTARHLSPVACVPYQIAF